jgi:hypothetical protein
MTKTKKRKLIEPAERIVNDAPRLHHTFEPGDVSHQGDLIFVCIHTLPASAKPRSNRQLAEGNTQGSRHVLERGEVYDCKPKEIADAIRKTNGAVIEAEYIGPVFMSPEAPTENDLTHPEHGNQGFPAGTVCAVVYQRNLDAEERAQTVRD